MEVDPLRNALIGDPIISPDDMARVLQDYQSPLLPLVDLLLQVRVRRFGADERSVNVVVAEVRRERPRRWVTVLVRDCFALYCTLRRAALPHVIRRATPGYAPGQVSYS